uniref:Major facilitator superfamily (MFS) profile domain-containing protein n=1 Tax=Clastoptera arizonana TaxID=38151 RepID=A0A1B6CY98_9HEMI
MNVLSTLFDFNFQAGVPERQLADLLREHNAAPPQVIENSFSRLFHAFLKPTGFKPLFLLLSLFFFQNFTGVYITIFYAVSFFQDVGSNLNAYTSTVLIGIVRMVVGLLTSYLLRQFGRRPLYMISGTGMAIAMGISGYFTREIVLGRMESNFIPVICVLIYMSLSVTGLMSIPWTMTAELYPIEIRGMAQGLTVSLAHVIMFSALKSYHFMIEGLGGMYAVQWMFAGISITSVIFVFIFLPETHKRLLADIQEYFVHNTVYLLSKDKKPVPTIIPMTGSLTSKPV